MFGRMIPVDPRGGGVEGWPLELSGADDFCPANKEVFRVIFDGGSYFTGRRSLTLPRPPRG